MARAFVCDETETPVWFTPGQRRKAFEAAELVAARLECEAAVVRRQNPDMEMKMLAIELDGRKSFEPSDLADAAALCKLVLEG